MFIPDPGSDFVHPGSRGQKAVFSDKYFISINLDFLVRAGLLSSELVAGKSQDAQTLQQQNNANL
jgi:hypothetical protein